MGALAGELHTLHSTTEHPAEQSLRNGTQTRGLLFARRSPTIRALADQIAKQVQVSLAALPGDPTHPFLARNTGRIRFEGSWSVRLRSSGFDVNHIHQKGWLSSALYIALPDRVGTGVGDASSPGALVFGVPPLDLGLQIAPSRIEQPKVGRLIIFPSYFWHGTVPFEGDQPRLTVAFDALPGVH
jgi:hypothetical protein